MYSPQQGVFEPQVLTSMTAAVKQVRQLRPDVDVDVIATLALSAAQLGSTNPPELVERIVTKIKWCAEI